MADEQQLRARILELESRMSELVLQASSSHAKQVEGFKARLAVSEDRAKHLEKQLSSALDRAEAAEAEAVRLSFINLQKLAGASGSDATAAPPTPLLNSVVGPMKGHESRGFPPITGPTAQSSTAVIFAEPNNSNRSAAGKSKEEEEDPSAARLHPDMLTSLVTTPVPSMQQPVEGSSSSDDSVEMRTAIEMAKRMAATAKQVLDMAISASGWIPEGERKDLEEKAQQKMNDAQRRIGLLEESRVALAAAKMEASQAAAAAGYVSETEKKELIKGAAAKMEAALAMQKAAINAS